MTISKSSFVKSTAARSARAVAEQLETRWLLAAEPYINEFLAQNNTINKDVDGDYSDWIELYNPNTTSISLNGYFLTDNRAKLNKWKIPNVSMSGQSYLLVWASNKNRTDPTKQLHTNFALSADGEYLGLVKPDGVTIDSEFAPTFPAQLPDISYGIRPDNGQVDYLKPTPGAANSTQGIVADTKFDHDRGYYSSPFDLAISTDTPGASIRYTTDGTAPTTTTGTLYTGPVHISTTTVVRAIAYKSGFTSTDVDAQSYIFANDVVKQQANTAGYPNPQEPINNPGPDETDVPFDYQMDPNVVNDPAYQDKVAGALESIPTLSIGMNKDDIFGPNGFYDTGINDDGVEKPISFEYIDPSNPADNVQVNAGISGHSKQRLKRSMNIHFRGTYGATKLDAEIFQHAPLGGDSATNEIDQLILRAGNNRAWTTTSSAAKTTFTEDEFFRESQIAMSGIGTHGTFVQLYINGLYWGLYNTVERPDAGFGAAYYGGNKDDWFAISQDGVQDGDATRWNFLINTLTTQDQSNPANYATMKQYLDVQEYADYIINQWYNGVSDWPNNNYWAGGDVAKKMPFQFYAWDGEFSWNTIFLSQNQPPNPPNGAWVHPWFLRSDTVNNQAPILKIWRALRDSPDFMTMFADRAYKALTNNGALTDANSLARWDTLSNFISDAVIDESARWGDSMISTGRPLRTRDGDWTPAVNAIRALIPGNAQQLIDAMRAAGYYPSIDPATMNQQGGLVPSGFKLSLTNPNSGGTIYYTTDGSDPRLPGGGLNPAAQIYSGTKINLTSNTLICLRVLKGSTWSAMNQAQFTINTIANLRVTELMYHPKAPSGALYDAEEYEFIELKNTGASSLNLNNVQIDGGVSFTFPNIDLAAGDHILVVKNQAAFQSLYGTGFNIAGEYSGHLSNSGDEIKLLAPGNVTLADFTYSDTWYPSTDGDGFSLVVIDPTDDPADLNNASSWRPSGAINGTPGSDESNIAPNSVVINELLSSSSAAAGDEIELKNTTGASIDISNWFLSDSLSNLKKFTIPIGTTIAAGGFIVFTQTDNFGSAFSFSSSGETAYLSSADSSGTLTGYQVSQKFGAANQDVPFERFVNSAGDVKFVAESAATFGAENAAPLVGPVVINEIHYNPTSGNAEFLELTNISASSVDLTGWTFTNGITFTFGSVSIDAGGFIVLTNSDPATVRASYHIPAAVPVFQFTGALDNSGETVELSEPGTNPGDLIVVDSVKFDDASPWPTAPDGSGPSLSKKTAALFGDDPISWQASALNNGTPGRDNASVNAKPTVNAGPDQAITLPANATLAGSAGDDGLPAGLPFSTTWSKVSGPGSVSFVDTSALSTTASFSVTGSYVLRLTASDGLLSNTDDISVTVGGNSPVAVSIAATDSSASEPGTDTGTYTVTRSGDLVGDLTVNLNTPTGTATSGSDYVALPTSVIIPDGQPSATITLTPKDDAIVEPTETVILSIAAGSGYVLGATTSATINIADNDVAPPPAFSAKVNFQPAGSAVPSGYSVDSGLIYGSRGNGLTYGWKSDLSALTRDRNSSASPDQRYDTLIQGMGTKNAWEIAVPNGTYQVHIVSGDAGYIDSVYRINVENVLLINGTPSNSTHWLEATGTVTVADGKLTIASAAGGVNNKIDYIDITSTGAVAPLPTVTVAATDPNAAEAGSDPGVFTVSRSGDTSSALTVNFTLGGSATNGADYNSLPLSVVILAGQASVTVTVKPIDDAIVDPNETVILSLSSSANYTIGASNNATVTIADNDASALFSTKINFQLAGVPIPVGYLADTGLVFGSHNGLQYGWNSDATSVSRDRDSKLSADQRYDTLVHMQYGGVNRFWELAVPNGTYQVHLVAGDSDYFTGNNYKINIENTLAINAIPTSAKRWVENTVTVKVTDGRLTINNASGALNNRINYVDVQQIS